MTAPADNLLRAWVAPGSVELRSDGDGDGNTLVGHFAVFNRWTTIDSWYEGRFLERIAPGAFADTFATRGDKVRVLYDHGYDPQIGNKPLGVPNVLREDKTGAYYEVSLFDAEYVRELKPAIAAGQMGASFRFKVTGETWVDPTKSTAHNPQKLPERTITGTELYEFGPVTFPAYDDASAGLRSRTDEFVDRLLHDPQFVARLTERAGLHVVERMIADAPAPDGPTDVDNPDATPDGQTAGQRTGLHPSVLRTQIEALRLARS